MKRRSILFAGLAGVFGLGWFLKPKKAGGDHSPYYQSLSRALHAHDIAKPTLVIDRKVLLENVATLSRHIDKRFAYRIVAKSLPSLPLLDTIMQASGSNRLMLFHQPFINEVANRFPDADILLGKPMPVAAAKNFYTQYQGNEFNSETQLRWLMDTPERVQQYDALAAQLERDMLVCIELDVGLHRGGVHSDEQLLSMLSLIKKSERLSFCGFMGYEPHVTKAPGNPVKYRDKAMAVYSHYLKVAQDYLGADWPEDVVLNAGGSPTYQMYDEGDYPFNELAAGSCLVQPSDFDIPSLADHSPASYIATPVLKRADTVEIPGINLGGLQGFWNPNRARTFFTYGGYWKAKPESPKGLTTNPLFGRSTNQEMFNGSTNINLQPDDWVFLRPTQSEFVFLQFGDIAIYQDDAITERWPVFSEQAS